MYKIIMVEDRILRQSHSMPTLELAIDKANALLVECWDEFSGEAFEDALEGENVALATEDSLVATMMDYSWDCYILEV